MSCEKWESPSSQDSARCLLAEETSGLSGVTSKTYYLYNDSGIFGAVFDDKVYYFVKNYRGDVIEIRDFDDNSLAASYEYDAWGNHKVYNANGYENTSSSFIGNKNPFRYRGYYYDTDLKLYYLQTRWYDPETGRFLNLDQISYAKPEQLNGINLYAYCLDNPVMNADPEGTELATFIGFLVELAVIYLYVIFVTSPERFYEYDIKEQVITSPTEDDINIVANGEESNPDGKIRVEISQYNLVIRDSYLIRDHEDMETVMKIIMESSQYKQIYDTDFRNLENFVLEWKAHNLLYSFGRGKRFGDVDFESKKDIRCIFNGLGQLYNY